jgi:WS/DGAT/MGAT family acyltransferase
MPTYSYERLSAQDNSFLLFETDNLPMHVASTQIFELGPLETAEGGVDYAEIKRFIGSVLHRIPRYRQVLRPIPLEGTPVWIDDEHFELDYHVRHTSLPRPGSDAQLRALAARVMAQRLDRARPLWEIWVVEGLAGGRFALINKTHHCMIDGTSGVDLGQILQSPTPERVIHEAPPYLPRPAPTDRELVLGAVRRRLAMPFRAASGLRAFRRETEDLWSELNVRARALRDMVVSQTAGVSETPINARIGPHRIFDWCTTPLSDMKALRRALGCTVNDVVLTIVTGAFREFLIRRSVRPDEIEFRVQAPVSVRREEERGQLGNRISAWLLRLPLDESDPLRQLARIHETTRELKESQQALGVEMMMNVMDVIPSALLALGARAATSGMNSIVTNVPGPQFPLYLLGAEMLEMYPQVPLFENIGLGIALVSYNGRVCWGFNADRELVPDLASFVAEIEASLRRVADVAEVKLGSAPAV